MDSPQYEKVLRNKAKIVGSLKLTPGATGRLITEFQQVSWLALYETPTEEKLVDALLGRLELDPDDFDKFIAMLKRVTGLDLILKILNECKGD